MIRKLDEIVAAVKNAVPCGMAVAVAQDEAVLRAAAQAEREGIAHALLVGDAAQIRALAAESGTDIAACEIVDEPDKTETCRRAAALVRDGYAKILMKGFVDTAVIMKAVLSHDAQLRTERLISHVSVHECPGVGRLLYITDSAMNIAPTLAEKADILRNAVAVAHALGNACPKAAVLCAVEKVSPKMACTQDASALTEMNRSGALAGCQVQGPLALDNALSEAAARHKQIAGEVAGRADILLTPDIESGNILNKAMEYLAHSEKASVIVGAAAPIVLTSRATTARSKFYSIALAALIAAQSDAAVS